MRKNLLLLAVVVIIFVVIAEVALRALGMGHPLWTKPDIWTGWRLRPYAAGQQTDEGVSTVTINAQGWRDSTRTMAKPANVIRVAVLGDSFVEGRQVNDRETLTQVAESILESCTNRGSKTVEVLNFGVSGFGTAQELLALQQYVWPYDPDIVVLAFTPGNDVRNNSLALEGPTLKPVATLSGSQLTLDMGFREIPAFRKQNSWYRRLMGSLVNDSRILQLLYGATRAQTASAAGEAGLDREIYMTPTGLWADAWKITETLIEAMNAQVTMRKASFVVLTTTQGIQVDPDAAKRQAFMDDVGVDDLFYAEKRLEMLGAQGGFPVVALAPALLQKAEETGMALHGFENTALGTGHWNARGHAAAGEVLATELCAGLTSVR